MELAHGSLTMRCYPLVSIVTQAYNVPHFQVSVPDWATSRFDVVAKAAGPVPDDQVRLMLRTLLADRFKLTLHHETRDLDLLVMTVGKNGPKLTPSDVDAARETQNDNAKGRIAFKHTTMTELAALLSVGGPSILDRTDLPGRYDFILDYARFLDPSGPGNLTAVVDAWREAIQADLGMKIERKKVPIDVLVVDHLEKTPTEN